MSAWWGVAVLSSGGPESLGSLRSSGATEGRFRKGGVVREVLCLGVVFFSSPVGNELVGVIYIERGYVVVQKVSGAWLALS